MHGNLKDEFPYSLSTFHKYTKRLNLQANIRRKKYPKFSVIEGKKYKNEINRDFKPSAPNKTWSIDITYLHHASGRSYMVAIKDLYSDYILAHEVSTTMNFNFVGKAIKTAIKKSNYKCDNSLTLHSDQGSHFNCAAYHNILRTNKIIGSHSRRGNCWDNAPIESFFSHFKEEGYRQQKVLTHAHACRVSSQYIKFYNNERMQEKHKWKTPKEIAYNLAPSESRFLFN